MQAEAAQPFLLNAMRSLSLAALLIALSIWCPTARGEQPRAEADEFLQQVRAHFAAWDRNGDGKLSADEVELAVDDPATKGTAAAAAGALRRGIRMQKLDSITLDQLTADATSSKLPHYQAMYKAALERITAARHEIFVSDTPALESLGQGHLGDCFLIATLGTVARNDPARLKTMFHAREDGKVDVTLGGGRKLIIDPPTDAELYIGVRNQNDGLWAALFEKSIGTIYLEKQKERRHVTPLSIVGVGGTPSSVLNLVTGHVVRRLGCQQFQKGSLSPAERTKELDNLRQQLAAAMHDHRLIVGGTAPLGGSETVVPGLYYNHSYGVLAYDEKTDQVTFWNPFGNHFTPKGPASLKTGYPTEHGIFTMPLEDAVMWFGAFSIETAEAG